MVWILNWLDATFGRFRWYRRLCGGHWERWCVAGCPETKVWLQTDGCSAWKETRPNPWCSGVPVCEDYGEWMPVDWSE